MRLAHVVRPVLPSYRGNGEHTDEDAGTAATPAITAAIVAAGTGTAGTGAGTASITSSPTAVTAVVGLDANVSMCVVDGREEVCGGWLRAAVPGGLLLAVREPLQTGVAFVAGRHGAAQREALPLHHVRRLVVGRLELLKRIQQGPA